MLISQEQQQNTGIPIQSLQKTLTKLLFKPMDAQELQDSEKLSTIWVKVLNKIVNKTNNTISSIIGMKPKDAIKLNTVQLTKIYLEETALPENELYRYIFQPGEQPGDKKDKQQTLFGVKQVSIRSNCTETR